MSALRFAMEQNAYVTTTAHQARPDRRAELRQLQLRRSEGGFVRTMKGIGLTLRNHSLAWPPAIPANIRNCGAVRCCGHQELLLLRLQKDSLCNRAASNFFNELPTRLRSRVQVGGGFRGEPIVI